MRKEGLENVTPTKHWRQEGKGKTESNLLSTFMFTWAVTKCINLKLRKTGIEKVIHLNKLNSKSYWIQNEKAACKMF